MRVRIGPRRHAENLPHENLHSLPFQTKNVNYAYLCDASTHLKDASQDTPPVVFLVTLGKDTYLPGRPLFSFFGEEVYSRFSRGDVSTNHANEVACGFQSLFGVVTNMVRRP